MKNLLISSLTVLGLTATSFLLSSSARAANLIQNGSFEDPAGTFVDNGQGIMLLNPGSTVIPGWTTTNAELAWINNNNVFNGIATPFESFFLDLTGSQDNFPYGGVSQTITTSVDRDYTLFFSLGILNPIYPGPISVTATTGSSSQEFVFNPSGSGNQWGNFSLDFTASTTSTAITIVGTSTANGVYIGLDNVSVVAVSEVPEPSSILGLLALGTLGTGSAILSKKRQDK